MPEPGSPFRPVAGLGLVAARFWAAVSTAGLGADAELFPGRLARGCAEVLGVAGAGLSLLHHQFRVPLGASDETATFAERLQFTLGEGPCLHAYRELDPVHVSGADIEARWPALWDQLLTHTPYRSIVSVPLLRIAPGRGGAIDLYLTHPDQAATFDAAEAVLIAAQVTSALALGADDPPWRDVTGPVGYGTTGPAWLTAGVARSRARVWTAIGMVNVSLDVNAEDALAVLRGYAYSNGRVLDDVADDLVTGALPMGCVV